MPKVLVCSEFSQIGSGYAIYTHELLKAFKKRGMEFAEMASFCNPTDQRIRNCAWKVYPVQPPPSDRKGVEAYNSHPGNAFGRQIFEQVLLDYKPTHVIDVRDVWNLVHEIVSPLRDFYSHIVMPAVDSDPQHKSWVNMYKKADGIITYCDWASRLLKEKYGIRNIFGSASPVPPPEFQPVENKDKIKESLGLGKVTVIGTVMRNQPRKLFPQLFSMFRKLLNETQRNDLYLYCHTSYPDVWELDELLLEHGVGHKVLFTYNCTSCGFVETSFYKGAVGYCINCKNKDKTLRFPTTYHPISQFTLNQIYNLFDLYIQYAALEGYGIPVAEAISAGIPTMCVNYSAMETFINEGNSIPIEVKEYSIEPETGRRFAIPDERDALVKILNFLDKSDSERNNIANFSRMIYGVRDFDSNAQVWVDAINNTKPKLDWNIGPRQYKLPTEKPNNISNEVFARWLISEVLQDNSYIGSWLEARLTRDLDAGLAFIGHDNKYYYEAMGIGNQRYQAFNQDIAFHHFSELLKEKLFWEQKRLESR